MDGGIHHHNIRKRKSNKQKPGTSQSGFKSFYDKFIYLVVAVTPLTNVPQLIKVWSTKDVTGVSALTWSGFATMAALWLIYGILHKDKPIVFVYSLLFIVQTSVAFGVFLYS